MADLDWFDVAFDGVFGAVQAWGFLTYFMIGGVCFLVGAFLIGDFLYWRIRGKRIKGRIKAVKVEQSKIAERKEVEPEPEKKEEQSILEMIRERPLGGLTAVFIIFLFASIPLAFFGFGAYTAHKYFSLKADGQWAESVVVHNERQTDSESGTSYYAVVAFHDLHGQRRQLRDNISIGGRPSYDVGEKLIVYYDPQDPERFIIDDFWHNMGIALGFMAVPFVLYLILMGIGRLQQMTNTKGKANKKPAYAGEMYRSVFEYQAPNGEVIECEADWASNTIADKIPGTELRLLALPHDPQKIRRPRLIGLMFGLFFGTPGVIFLYLGFSNFTLTPYMAVIFLALLGYVVFKIAKTIKPREEWETVKEFQTRKKLETKIERSKGRLLSDIEVRERLRWADSYLKHWVLFLIVLAAGVATFGYYSGQNMLALISNGETTTGRVVRVDSRYDRSSDGGGYTYYAIVDFNTFNGERVEFQDSIGSSAPLQQRGDEVSVLYDPASPQDAIIDRGLLNWAMSGGCFILGLFLLMHALKSYIGIRRRVSRI